MLTRQLIKNCITTVGKITTYFMFFEIIQDGRLLYYFNAVSLTEDEIKELEPIRVISKRAVRLFFKTQYKINDMGKYKNEKDIINFYFPTIMYQNKYTKQYFYVFSSCQNFLENKKLIKGMPSIKINFKEFNE